MFSWIYIIHGFISALFIYFGYLIYKFFSPPLSANNKAVFITGCDTGFGHYFAQRMAERNYRVFAGCLFPEGEGANTLKSFSSKIQILSLDVTDAQSIKEAVKTVEISLGTEEILWGVINNAGRGLAGEVEWTPMDSILKVFDINVFGVVRIMQGFLPLLRKSKGRLINLTSIAAVRRTPSIVPYSMSKAAASSFSDGIRLELKKWNITVINIQPYFYSTHITDSDSVSSYYNYSWKNADPENTSVLGDKYFKKYTKQTISMLNLLNNKCVEDVIKCLEDAVTSPSPQLYYRPGNLINKICLDVPHFFPAAVQDFFHSFVISQ